MPEVPVPIKRRICIKLPTKQKTADQPFKKNMPIGGKKIQFLTEKCVFLAFSPNFMVIANYWRILRLLILNKSFERPSPQHQLTHSTSQLSQLQLR